MATLEEILTEQKLLNTKLYGDETFEGDIPELKKLLRESCQNYKGLNGRVNKLSGNFKLLVGILVGSGVISGGALGVAKLWIG